jgi:carbamoyltransferase
MRILGISAHYHDSAAALLVGGVPVCAVQQERLSRRKGDPSFPLEAIAWCLERAALEPEMLDAVVFYEKPLLKFERILTCALRAFPRSWRSFPRAMRSSLGEKLWIKGIISAQLGIPARKILFAEHHYSHAAAAFFTAPTQEAAILTADGVGEWATLTTGRGRRRDGHCELTLTREIRFPHSLGMLYSTLTAFLGFAVNDGEYKVMGLAAYGKPTFEDTIRRMLTRTEDGAFRLDLRYFEYHTTAHRAYSRLLIDELGTPRNSQDPIVLESPDGQRFADIAASVQLVLEEVLVDIARGLQRETGCEDLCLGGGVALNGCANARLLAESGFRRLFVPSAPGDAGCALGAALWADRHWFSQPDREFPDHPYWGPEVEPSELVRLAAEDGLELCDVADERTYLGRVAEALDQGQIVGWMDGRSEFGPRALGSRSILASPHSAATRDRLNQSVKYREEFRPFAPAVPAERASTFFELPPGGERLARFMSGVFKVRPQWRNRLAAVTHVDGSARLQAVSRDVSPRFHALLEAYGERTGIPVLLNTSLNLAGEPIVNTAREGYSAFRRSGIDVLASGRYLLFKRPVGSAERGLESVA